MDSAALLQTAKSGARDDASKELFEVIANRNVKKSESIDKGTSKAGLQPVISVKAATASKLVADAATCLTEGSRRQRYLRSSASRYMRSQPLCTPTLATCEGYKDK